MLAPAPYSLIPSRRSGYFAWISSSQGPNSPSVPLYQPKYLLKEFSSVHQLDGSSSLALAADVEGLVSSCNQTEIAAGESEKTGTVTVSRLGPDPLNVYFLPLVVVGGSECNSAEHFTSLGAANRPEMTQM